MGWRAIDAEIELIESDLRVSREVSRGADSRLHSSIESGYIDGRLHPA